MKVTLSPSQKVSFDASELRFISDPFISVTVIEFVAVRHAEGSIVTESCSDLSYTLTSKTSTPLNAE